ncbi:MAG: hypothetical protein LC112_01305 [Flavobacteriales bacterium]|nr:hypothetical protein [Flavobacteriales bacterium]
MKKIFLVLFFLLFSNIIYSQNTEIKNDNNIYLKAIKEYIKQIDEFYKSDFFSPNKHKVLLIQKETFLKNIPTKMDGYKIVEINESNKKKLFGKKPKILVQIFPLKYENGRYFISITPYSVTFKKNNYTQTISDWTIVYFKDIDGKMTFEKTENGGI